MPINSTTGGIKPPPITDQRIVAIMGGGPGGCATAIGLARLGIKVVIINQPRKREALEGFSSRTLKILKSLGAKTALNLFKLAVKRKSQWNGVVSETSQEWIVKRSHFDKALLKDTEKAGVTILTGKVISTQPSDNGWLISWRSVNSRSSTHTLKTDFLVEARGRVAPRHQQTIVSGPASYAIGQHWKLKNPLNTSLVVTLEEGWGWWASTEHHAHFQCVVGKIEKYKHQQLYQQCIDQIPEVKDWLKDATPITNLNTCGAKISRFKHTVGDNWIRVGDAALAPDPLSGQGVFEAMASAFAAIPTINTLMFLQTNAHLAYDFYHGRCRERFLSIARTGRDFYKMKQGFINGDFWHVRQDWPDQIPSHMESRKEKPYIKKSPVVIDQFIQNREVVITADHPRGILALSGVPLAPLIKYLNQGGMRADLHFNIKYQYIYSAQHWLKQRGLL